MGMSAWITVSYTIKNVKVEEVVDAYKCRNRFSRTLKDAHDVKVVVAFEDGYGDCFLNMNVNGVVSNDFTLTRISENDEYIVKEYTLHISSGNIELSVENEFYKRV